MPTDFEFIDTPGFVWVDTPGHEFIDTEASANIRKLRNLQVIDVSTIYKVVDVSTIYKCQMIVGGEVVYDDFEVNLGSGNIIDFRVIAENVETEVIEVFTPEDLAIIEWCKLALDNVVIDSAAAGVGLGADQPFDNETKAALGILSLKLGGLEIPAKTYRTIRLALKFSNTAEPKVLNLKRQCIVYPAIA